MWVGLKVFLRDREAYSVCGNHALVVFGMRLEIVFQHHAKNGCSLAVPSDDEWTTLVVILKIIVERCRYITVGYSGNRSVYVPGLLRGFLKDAHPALAVKRYEHIGGILEETHLPHMLVHYAH